MFERVKDVGHPCEELLSVYRDHGVVKRQGREDNFNKAALDRKIYQLIHPGWLAINRMKAWQGSVGISPYRGIVSGHYICFRPNHSEDNRFLNWLLRSAPYAAEYSSLSRGVRPNQVEIDNEWLQTLLVKLPPLESQRRIADFLDVETSRIDRLIKVRQGQISLLEERSDGLIFDAIRGSEESARSESGLAWLGSIPTGWAIMPVGFQFEVLLGKMLNQENVRGSDLLPYLRNTNVQWDRITTDDLLLMNFPPEEHRRYAVRSGDLLVCEGGEPGRAAIWDGRVSEIYYQKALHRVRPRGYSSPRWLFYCLRAATAQNVFAVEGNTTTISHLTGEQLRAHRFPFPSREVQDRLVAQLDAAALRQENLIAAFRRQLALLVERRQALITAAVTGQFDVSTASGRNVTDGVQP
ncbi:restriction endonuclease subunit S [Streptomyces sp. S4.7]|uniref:restriction endonuclease subunit S n=1 Tax=Streptomyces sp. S4.7 TaxID=2705439 RepID=UPI0013DA051C|nr:restriction endonuclease subunit S [Streptomyces sp. S4.7]